MKKQVKIYSVMIAAYLIFSGVAVAKNPVPDDDLFPNASRDYTETDVDRIVFAEQEIIEPYRSLTEYGVDTSTIPERYDCENIKFMRFRLNNEILGFDPINADYADAGLIMTPGVIEGANGFEYIARHLVYKAYVNRGMNIEIWAMDRRGNCVEDLTGVDAIEEIYYKALADDKDGDGNSVDPCEEQAMLDTASGYYYRNMEIDGKTFDGWYSGKDLPFLAEFGLQMDTEDMYQILESMVTTQAGRKAKVFVGGHSLGGLHASFFAGWDKDGNPATKYDAGFNNLAGLFCFDSIVGPADNVVNDIIQQFLPLSDYLIGFGEEMTKPVYKLGLAGLRSGVIPRIAEGDFTKLLVGSPVGPEAMTLLEVVGIFSHALPEKEHTAVSQFYSYLGKDVKDTLQKYISKDFNQLFWRNPTILDYRLTNEAMLGLFFDDDYTHISLIAASMGFMYNGSVVKKGRLVTFNPTTLLSTQQRFVPADSGFAYWWWGWRHAKGPLYKWADFDEVARTGTPMQSTNGKVTYTTFENEMSSIRSLSRSLFKGPTNLVEWYFPIRKVLDMVAGITEYGQEYGLNCIYPDQVEKLPKLEFVGEQGVMGPLRPLLTDSEGIPGVNHIDPMFISANTSELKENPVIDPLLNFVEENITP